MKQLENQIGENTIIEYEENCKIAPTDYQILNIKNLCTICNIHFQDDLISEKGINGITMENLIEILIHRLQHFQLTLFACPENDEAIIKLTEALKALRQRTIDRTDRGVVGTYDI